MTAKHTQSETTTFHVFEVKHKGRNYRAKIYLNAKGKFVDEEITDSHGNELESEGTEGDIREKITDYLANHWDELVQE